jgi:periplasmic protein TonB
MATLVVTILLGSVLSGDLRQKGEGHLYISEGAGNRRITQRIQPICPDDSCTLCEHAEVILQLAVNKSGAVKQVSVVRAGDSRLAEAALHAVKQWRYSPYILNGSPVEYETRTTIKSWTCRT